MPRIKGNAGSTDEIPGPVMPFPLSLPSSHLLGLSAALTLLLAPGAQAATRFAAPAGAGSACTQDAPCAVADAVSGAATGDDVVLAAGDYDVITPLKAAAGRTIEGAPGQPRARLLGSPRLAGDTLSLGAGGAVRHLEIQG